MINKILLSVILSYSVLFIRTNDFDANKYSVNAVIGDVSFIEKFGVKPESTTNVKLRITTHLEYVANKLKISDVSHLSPELSNQRTLLLSYLNEYIEAESFPGNFVSPDRSQSVFIDKNGRICAVGYLVEKSVGRTVAEKINEKYKFSSVFDIKGKTFEKWVSESGFTKKELAMIQPSYGPPINEPDPEPVSEAYDVGSSILIGMNTTLSFVNASQAIRGDGNKTFPIVGLISGAGQLILGITNYPENNAINKRKRELSLLNIGFGTLTVALSSFNLFKIKENKEKSYAVRLKNFSLPQHNVGMGLSFSKRF